MEKFMKKWDAADDKGAPVPCDKETINSLDATVGVALVDRFLERTSVSEEELGN
jgi:hypothetical protein